tara:strand:+ start:230 stop:1159 length:930 start_codon:yes stop_codon:yes gene_type:complete
MGKKVNVYLDDKTLNMWLKIPSGQRSALIRDAIRNHAANENSDPKEELIMKLREQLSDTNSEIVQLEHTREMLTNELERMQVDLSPVDIDKNRFFCTIEDRARIFINADANYRSFTGKSYYRIHDVVDGKIYIRNIRTGRTNSNFSRKTVDKAIDRLVAAGGKLPVGQFIPVKMHEYTVVHLHPQLYVKDGFIHWNQSEMAPVDEKMIPNNPDLAAKAPDAWISNEHWLAVTVDGMRGHMCIYHSTTHWSSQKISISLIDEHPHFTEFMQGNDGIWWTKYYMFKGDGILYWGHHHKGGGSTQTILTPNN